MVYSTRQFVLCLALCYFVLVFFNPFSIAITSIGEERASLGAFCTFFDLHLQSILNSSNTDGSFNMANSNSFSSPYEILPIAQENKYIGKFS